MVYEYYSYYLVKLNPADGMILDFKMNFSIHILNINVYYFFRKPLFYAILYTVILKIKELNTEDIL